MRLVKFILDLPWWAGLAIFLVANLVIPFNFAGLGFGLFFCFLGMWVFSKLLLPPRFPTNLDAIIGLPLFIACMLIFGGYVHWPWLTKDYNILYGIRAITGMLFGLIGFKGFRNE